MRITVDVPDGVFREPKTAEQVLGVEREQCCAEPDRARANESIEKAQPVGEVQPREVGESTLRVSIRRPYDSERCDELEHTLDLLAVLRVLNELHHDESRRGWQLV